MKDLEATFTAEEISFYEAGEAREILGVSTTGLEKLTEKQLLLTQHLDPVKPGGIRRFKYAVPFVHAAARYINMIGARPTESTRPMAYGAGRAVQDFIDVFDARAHELAPSGKMKAAEVAALTGVGRNETSVVTHRFGRFPAVEQVLQGVRWQHITLGDVPLLTNAEVCDRLNVSRTQLPTLANEGRMFAQRLRYEHGKRRGSDFRYPEEYVDVVAGYAERKGLSDYQAIVNFSKTAAATALRNTIAARFRSSAYRASRQGELACRDTGKLVRLSRTVLQATGIRDGYPLDALLERVEWSHAVVEPKLPQEFLKPLA